MKINEIMSREVRTISPDTPLREVAQIMRQADIGALVINQNDRMAGMVTDRDLVVRAMAEGMNMDTPVSRIMSDEVRYCFDDEEIDHVAKNMAQIEKRRLPVVNRDKRLVGMVSLANVASCNADKVSANLLRGVAQPH
ncbi:MULTISPECIES: CBS domain-containing protein [Pseudomonas]|jgi:CBS domain-containing protein|uniref:Inosine-5-monophosphate dehydrogenase n=1 Tax=Pseudomonas frederiksbergensis TaxID=104087 RepID=A0A0B1ZAB8_9PSED|nr:MULTISPECIES: CBS domain-containing protein [Pseudomonas]KHK66337.1 inosine-5-monophosphate dehydrogenase [Pseudomonas frederiksbergensis]KJH86168.1 inosine-5-monophosphate dehydrogenase [Pseudomonas fluorescens]MBI6618363.1 CBS domain-containing protein [Pseudomonas corrugata]MBI6695227.1 CBS domain-containing protein [Pseudomonas corrugata]WRV70854.1 CBS domain-containing protein [Pseudomonas frederiksbergensis]